MPDWYIDTLVAAILALYCVVPYLIWKGLTSSAFGQFVHFCFDDQVLLTTADQ